MSEKKDFIMTEIEKAISREVAKKNIRQSSKNLYEAVSAATKVLNENSSEKKKNLAVGIPVSCFTATAKQKVIEDIREYFKEKLSLELELFTSKASRTNLQYKVFEKGGEEEKYQAAREAEKRGVSTPPRKKTPLDKKYKNREMGIGRALKRLQKD
jgi:hypothetical protein